LAIVLQKSPKRFFFDELLSNVFFAQELL